jgi:hypothetical protein
VDRYKCTDGHVTGISLSPEMDPLAITVRDPLALTVST